MKKVILVGDGMGDYPINELGGKSPLQAADIPHIRRAAAAGRLLMVQTVPEGMEPGSDVANLGLLGYNAAESYTGRAPIEAAGAGIELADDDVAFRCNLVTIQDETMKDYSAGHITTEEARELILAVNEALGREGLQFHPGVSYRHLLVWKDGPADAGTTPPHDITDRCITDHLPRGAGANELRSLLEASRDILVDHPVNRKRIDNGISPATQIWLWGQGRRLQIPTYKELYNLSGGIVSAVDLVRGLGILAGLEAPHVEGATGFIDTNYEGKVAATMDLLKDGDFAYLHLEAPDECGHMGDAKLKTKAIEAFDARIVEPVWSALEEIGQPYRMVVCMDHRTPVSTKSHTSEPIPMAIVEGPVGKVTDQADFDEDVNGGQSQGMSYDIIRDMLAK